MTKIIKLHSGEEREIEHQAKQYSVRLTQDVRDDARELAMALKGETAEAPTDDKAA